VDALEQLVETGALFVDPCACDYDLSYTASLFRLDEDELSRELDGLMAPIKTDPYDGDHVDQYAARTASQLLTGFVDGVRNRFTWPSAAAALKNVCHGLAPSYRRPPHVPYLPGIIEDVELIVSRERELDKSVSRKATQIHARLMVGRVTVCMCFFQTATVGELEERAHSNVWRWNVADVEEAKSAHLCLEEALKPIRARRAVDPFTSALNEHTTTHYANEFAAGRAVVGAIFRQPDDEILAARVAEPRGCADREHFRTHAVMERWRTLTSAELALPPAALYKQLIEFIDRLDVPVGPIRRRGYPDG
jgi:hypothetical protein